VQPVASATCFTKSPVLIVFIIFSFFVEYFNYLNFTTLQNKKATIFKGFLKVFLKYFLLIFISFDVLIPKPTIYIFYKYIF